VKAIAKLADEIRIALGNLEEIDRNFAVLLNSDRRDTEAALLFGRYVELHYNRVETVLLHIKHAFGNDVQADTWHKSLLYAMTRTTSERERVISDATFHALDELRGFRHFVRYNYRLDNYDWDRMDAIGAMYRKSLAGVSSDFRTFLSYLEALRSEVDDG
jgi:hypothetical protein